MPIFRRVEKKGARHIPIKKGDRVLVLRGKDAGKQGKVIASDPRRGTVTVDRINIVIRHERPRGQSTSAQKLQTGRIEKPAPMAVGKVMLICPECAKPGRVAMKLDKSGKHHRVCRRCGEPLDTS
jgi:large subunit ribosomal protein L24